jgi:hypothetical protein
MEAGPMAARRLLPLLLLLACGEHVKESGVWLPSLTAAQGLSLRIPDFEVPRGTEVQRCYFLRVPDTGGGDLWVDKTVIGLAPGSHHFNVFRVRTLAKLKPENGAPVSLDGVPATVVDGGECFKGSNWPDWPLVVNSQESSADRPYYEWKLPEGVGYRLSPGELIMLQIHYVNLTVQETPKKARVVANFHRAASPNPIELGTLFATQQSIRICEHQPQPKYFGACAFPSGQVHVAAVNGHFHSRGRRFTVRTWDGQTTTEPPSSSVFYESTNWAEPPMATGLEVLPPEGGGIWWTCEYQWEPPADGCAAVNAVDSAHAGDCCYTFGPHVGTQEHCNVFLYYWPKVGATDVFCN